MYSKLNEIIKKNKKFCIAFCLFLVTFLFFIFLYKEWYFVTEDYCPIFRVARIKSFKNFLNIFIFGDVKHYLCCMEINPADGLKVVENTNYSFFESFYRPFLLFIYFVLYHLFGLNAYWYYIFFTFLHALIVTLLFYSFTLFISIHSAILCSLFFAFSPSLIGWFGKIDTLQHPLNLLLAILAFILVVMSIKNSKENIFLFFSALLFLFCLLTRETFIIIPFFVSVGCIFAFLFSHYSAEFKKKLLKLSVLFIIALSIYVLLRQIAYPFKFAETDFHFSFSITLLLQKCQTAFYWIINFVYNSFLNLFISNRFYFFCVSKNIVLFYKIIKNSLFLILFLLFFKNEKKRELFFLLIIFNFMFWPSLITGGALRYLYEGLPLGLLLFGILLDFSYLKKYSFFSFIKIFFWCLLCINIFFNFYFGRQIFRWMENWKSLDQGIREFKKTNPMDLKNRCILFLSVHNLLKNQVGILDAFQLHGCLKESPKVFCRYFELCFDQKNSIENYLRVRQFYNELRITSLDKEKLWFILNGDYVSDLELCAQNVNFYEKKDEKVFDFGVVLKEKFSKCFLKIIVWDHIDKKFVII